MGTRYDLALKRLFNQFKSSSDLKDLFKIFTDYMEETDQVVSDVALNRWKDTSEGVWLDIIAEIVGIPVRPAKERPIDGMFSYRSLAETKIDTAKGYGNLVNTNGGHYRSLLGNPLASGDLIDDDTLSVLIEMKIFANTLGCSIPDIWDYIKKGFGAETTLTTSDGLVEVYFKDEAPYLDDLYRRFLVEYAPLQTGTKIVVRNWPTP